MTTYAKTCSICGELKTTDHFWKNKKSKDGLKSMCEVCSRKKRRDSKRERIHADSIFRMDHNISRTMLKLLKGEQNWSSVLEYLDYGIDELRSSFESQFEPWMTWENHGRYDENRRTWQIDHIVPRSKLKFYSLTHPNFKRCWALNNLRPLEASKNIGRK